MASSWPSPARRGASPPPSTARGAAEKTPSPAECSPPSWRAPCGRSPQDGGGLPHHHRQRHRPGALGRLRRPPGGAHHYACAGDLRGLKGGDGPWTPPPTKRGRRGPFLALLPSKRGADIAPHVIPPPGSHRWRRRDRGHTRRAGRAPIRRSPPPPGGAPAPPIRYADEDPPCATYLSPLGVNSAGPSSGGQPGGTLPLPSSWS